MNYKTYKLSEIASVQTGPFGSQLHKKDYVDDGIPIITVEHLGENKILHQNLPRVGEDDYNRLSKYHLQTDDIVFSRVGSVDRRALVSKSEHGWMFSGRCLRVRVTDSLVNPKYLSYLFGTQSFKEYIRSIAVGATMPSINTKILSDIEVDIPSLDLQNKVVDILYKIDLKIWNNENLINSLEQISQTLYKRWFIDFEFPNEEGLPYRVSGGKMVESELGEMPEDWSVEYLSSSTEFLSGGTPKTKEPSYWNGDIPFFTPKDVGSSPYTTNTEKTITDLGLSKCNSKLYPKNIVFITARGTVGKVALANRDMAMNQSCFALKSKLDTQFFLYGMIQMLLREIIQGANGAVFNAINLTDLNRLQVKMPTNELIRSYEELVKPLFDQMSELEFENIKLQNIRDSLLPRLLSGEIEIK